MTLKIRETVASHIIPPVFFQDQVEASKWALDHMVELVDEALRDNEDIFSPTFSRIADIIQCLITKFRKTVKENNYRCAYLALSTLVDMQNIINNMTPLGMNIDHLSEHKQHRLENLRGDLSSTMIDRLKQGIATARFEIENPGSRFPAGGIDSYLPPPGYKFEETLDAAFQLINYGLHEIEVSENLRDNYGMRQAFWLGVPDEQVVFFIKRSSGHRMVAYLTGFPTDVMSDLIDKIIHHAPVGTFVTGKPVDLNKAMENWSKLVEQSSEDQLRPYLELIYTAPLKKAK